MPRWPMTVTDMGARCTRCLEEGTVAVKCSRQHGRAGNTYLARQYVTLGIPFQKKTAGKWNAVNDFHIIPPMRRNALSVKNMLLLLLGKVRKNQKIKMRSAAFYRLHGQLDNMCVSVKLANSLPLSWVFAVESTFVPALWTQGQLHQKSRLFYSIYDSIGDSCFSHTKFE